LLAGQAVAHNHAWPPAWEIFPGETRIGDGLQGRLEGKPMHDIGRQIGRPRYASGGPIESESIDHSSHAGIGFLYGLFVVVMIVLQGKPTFRDTSELTTAAEDIGPQLQRRVGSRYRQPMPITAIGIEVCFTSIIATFLFRSNRRLDARRLD